VGPHGTALSTSVQAGHLFSLTKIKNMLLSASRFVKIIAQTKFDIMHECAKRRWNLNLTPAQHQKLIWTLIDRDGRKAGTGLQAEDEYLLKHCNH